MYVDCKVVNNIMVNYKYHISRLDDMLNKFHGSYIFIEINLKNKYY
jgi:hypothetical protein